MSAFVVKKIQMESCVIPFSFRDVKSGLQQIFSGDLFKYVPELGGVLLGWKDIRVQETKVRIQSELDGSVWVPFTASLLLWAPKCGDILRGRIVKHAPDFISVVVHDIWNAVIPYAELPRHFNRDVKYMQETEHYVQFAVKELKASGDSSQSLTLIGTLRAADTGFIPKDSDVFEPATSLLRHLKLVDSHQKQEEEEEDADADADAEAAAEGDEVLTLSTPTINNKKKQRQSNTVDDIQSPVSTPKKPLTSVPSVNKKKDKQQQKQMKEEEEAAGEGGMTKEEKRKSSKKRKERPDETASGGVQEEQPKSKKSKTDKTPSKK